MTGFTRLTKDIIKFEAPFDERFRDMMVNTAKHLMDCGFRVVYAFTESDEISLLFHKDEDAFGRKIRKFNSMLAGEASAAFTLLCLHGRREALAFGRSRSRKKATTLSQNRMKRQCGLKSR